MNKDIMYFAVFAVLCVLAGVLVGASITKRVYAPCPMPGNAGFTEKAEHFMRYGPREPGFREGGRRGGKGIFTMLVSKLELNENQQTQVKEILDKARREIEKVGEGVRGSIDEIRKNSDQQIMAILTPQQQEKFKALQAEAQRRGSFKKNAMRCGPMPRGMAPESMPGEGVPPPPGQE